MPITGRYLFSATKPGYTSADWVERIYTAKMPVPTSLLVGDADYPPLIQANREAAARIRGCELTVVPGMDHLPPLREPGLVLRTITSTLARAGW